MRACHIEPASGHMGIRHTVYRIIERFYWKGLNKDVEKMVRCVLQYTKHLLSFIDIYM